MNRRGFLQLTAGTTMLWPLPARSQATAKPPLVAVIVPFLEDLAKERTASLRVGLKQAGLVEGVDFTLTLRFASGDFSKIAEFARELAGLKPRVFAVIGGGMSIVRKEAPDIPLVFAGVAVDPIAAGLVQSYVRPGGLVTGQVMNAIGGEEGLATKRFGYLKELVPNLARVGMIGLADSETPNPAQNLAIPERNALQKVAAQLGFAFSRYDIKTLDDLDAAVEAGMRDDVSAFYISGDPRMNNVARVVTSLARSKKPACAVYPFWARAGLLMSYSNDPADGARRAGIQVAKIIRGANPADLPVEQAEKFLLTINLKTAKQLGITAPANLLAVADEVIE